MDTKDTSAHATTVLIADDEPCTRQITEVYLKEAGYDTLVAEDGDEALRLAKRAVPDAILLDYNLPPSNGLEVARDIKRGLRTRKIPIALVTASAATLASKEGDNATVWAARLKKPFNQETLIALVESMTTTSDHSSTTSGSTPSCKRKRALPESVKRNFLERLRDKVTEMNALLDVTTAASDRDVLDRLHGHLHQVHGAAGLCGFAPLGEAAAGAERLIETWLTLHSPGIDIELDRIRRVVEQFAAALPAEDTASTDSAQDVNDDPAL